MFFCASALLRLAAPAQVSRQITSKAAAGLRRVYNGWITIAFSQILSWPYFGLIIGKSCTARPSGSREISTLAHNNVSCRWRPLHLLELLRAGSPLFSQAIVIDIKKEDIKIRNSAELIPQYGEGSVPQDVDIVTTWLKFFFPMLVPLLVSNKSLCNNNITRK